MGLSRINTGFEQNSWFYVVQSGCSIRNSSPCNTLLLWELYDAVLVLSFNLCDSFIVLLSNDCMGGLVWKLLHFLSNAAGIFFNVHKAYF